MSEPIFSPYLSLSGPTGSRYWVARRVLPMRPDGGAPIERGFVEVLDGRIVAVGRVADLPASVVEALSPLLARAEAEGWVLTPGLINAHTHLEQSGLAAIPGGEGMARWLLSVIPQMQAWFLPEAAARREAAIRRGAEAMLAAGVTCVNDISRLGESLPVLDALGLRGVVSLEFFHPDCRRLNPEPLDALLVRYRQLAEAYQGHPRLAVGLSPHSPYNVSPAAWAYVRDRLPAHLPPACWHTHLAESRDECDYLAGRPEALNRTYQALFGVGFGVAQPAASPVAYLKNHGLLSAGLVAAHGLETDDADRALLAASAVGVAHCPASNRFLHGKTLDVSQWQGEDAPLLALGTDGSLSGGGLDLRAEARAVSASAGVSPEALLAMMTRDAARVLGLGETAGRLVAGCRADLALWRTSLAQTCPYQAVLAADARPLAAAVDGVVRYRHAEVTC